MTQYQVPQFIDVEDRIIGPLTLKQFLYLAGGGALLLVTWFVLNIFVWLIAAVPITAIALTFAFIKVNDRPFIYFVMSAFHYYIKARLYVWAPKKESPAKPEEAKPEVKEIAPYEQAPSVPKVTRSKLRELALSLDIGARRINQNNQSPTLPEYRS